MNCRQCGAPMNVEEGQNFFHCGYCGCYDFPNPNLDGVALLDEASPYPCPICNKPLVSAIVNNVRIFSCPKCRGNLIEQSKMLPIIRQSKSLDTINEDLQYPPEKSELTRTVTCPSCQKMMAVYPYGGPGNIIIQGCEQCRLIWLDFGELSRIIRSYLQMYNQSTDEPGAKKKWVAF
jgi:Zn-finger nucleic acid-binding protein